MTILEVLEAWKTRFSLDGGERLALAEAVHEYVERGPLAEVPNDEALSRKLGARSMRQAAERVVRERLFGDEAPLVKKIALVISVGDAVTVKAAPDPTIPRVGKRRARVRCSVCGGFGHNRQTCSWRK